MKFPIIVNILLFAVIIFSFPIQRKSIDKENRYLVCQPYNFLCKLKQIYKCRCEGVKYLKSYSPEKSNEIYKLCTEILTYNGQPHEYTLKSNIKLLGRAYFLDDNTLWFSLTNTGFEYKFWGKSTNITIAADTGSNDTENPAKVLIYTDGVLYNKVYTKKDINKIKINFEKTGEHIVRILKASESIYGSLRLKQIQTDLGKFEPTPESDKKIEFIGDSITCGFGVDSINPGSSFTTKTEDGSKAYPYKVAQKFNADYSMISYSGYGIMSGFSNNGIRNANETVPLYYDTVGYTKYFEFKEDNYNLQLKNVQWDANEFIPDLIVINLGTNDGAYIDSISDENLKKEAKELFVTEYIKFIRHARTTHPNASILCTLGILGNNLFPQIVKAVKNYISETNDNNVKTFEFNVHNTEKNGVGAQWHPSALSHIDAANELINEIEKIYKWIPDSNVKINK